MKKLKRIVLSLFYIVLFVLSIAAAKKIYPDQPYIGHYVWLVWTVVTLIIEHKRVPALKAALADSIKKLFSKETREKSKRINMIVVWAVLLLNVLYILIKHYR